jgi:hypothetical protein
MRGRVNRRVMAKLGVTKLKVQVGGSEVVITGSDLGQASEYATSSLTRRLPALGGQKCARTVCCHALPTSWASPVYALIGLTAWSDDGMPNNYRE